MNEMKNEKFEPNYMVIERATRKEIDSYALAVNYNDDDPNVNVEICNIPWSKVFSTIIWFIEGISKNLEMPIPTLIEYISDVMSDNEKPEKEKEIK